MSSNNKQPNFEHIKRILYKLITKDDKLGLSLLTGSNIPFYKKKKSALNSINEIIDNLDIRAIESLPIELQQHFPTWFKDNKYTIDCNEHGFLDFIRIDHESEF